MGQDRWRLAAWRGDTLQEYGVTWYYIVRLACAADAKSVAISSPDHVTEGRYCIPNHKWLGSAYAHLECAPSLQPVLHEVLSAAGWREREGRLSAAYEIVAAMHNALDLTPPLAATVSPYHGRPYLTLHARRFAEALVTAINDPAMRGIIERVGLIGGVDQVADSVDLLTDANLCARLRALYAG